MFKVKLTCTDDKNILQSKDVFINMTEADAIKVSERMNRLNALISKRMGVIIKNVFVATKDGNNETL